MTLAQMFPPGAGARIIRAASEALARRRDASDYRASGEKMLGWLGLSLLTFAWVKFTLVAFQVHSMIADFEFAHGDVVDQWQGRVVRAPEFERLMVSLEAIDIGAGSYVYLGMFPISLVVLFGFWVGCSRWALRSRPATWRITFIVAFAIAVSQAVLLFPEISAYGLILA